MIEFRYKKPAYYVGVINNLFGLRTLAKFDSGAAISIIGLERFGIELQNKMFLDFFVKYALDNGINKEIYTAANEQKIEVYPCVIDDISLDGEIVLNFRFGLVSEQKSNRFLLGDDFVSCCDFRHSIGSSIVVDNFSQSRYDMNMTDNTKRVNLNIVLSEFREWKQNNC